MLSTIIILCIKLVEKEFYSPPMVYTNKLCNLKKALKKGLNSSNKNVHSISNNNYKQVALLGKENDKR